LSVVRYRVEAVAAACDVSVDTVRYYQSKGLLPPPGREGRVAWYGTEHVERIREIRALQQKGLTLAAIKRVVEGGLGRVDADLAAAVAAAQAEGEGHEGVLSLDQFAAASGVPASLIQAVEREGIHLSRSVDGEERYAAADIQTVRAALKLLEFGLPLGELLSLARQTHEAMLGLAQRAVELFDDHVRKPIRDTAASDEEAATRLVEAFRSLLPAVTDLVANHFRRVLLRVAEDHIERVGESAEVEATRAESQRMGRTVP
jgi:DNA-binding transcriptional MerR regulator